MPERGISLVREEIAREFVKNRGDVFRIRITAKDNVLMPKHIFAHQKWLVNPYDGTEADEFCFIASPFDSTIYPIGQPDPNQFPPFFRKDQIDVLVPSTEDAETVWDTIHLHVCNLAEAYNRLDALVEVETVRCGGVLESTDSVSESGSESESASESVEA